MAADLVFTLESAEFFSIGRVLQRGFGKSAMGEVALSVDNGMLAISAKCGGGLIPVQGEGNTRATIKAKSFCSLITTRFRERSPSGPMFLIFRPDKKEISIAGASSPARFISLKSEPN